MKFDISVNRRAHPLADLKPLSKNLYSFDEERMVLKTKERGVFFEFQWESWESSLGNKTMTFITGDNCAFHTNYKCIFHTGVNCTFRTGHECKFITGDDCYFSTQHNCTFKVGHKCIIHCLSNSVIESGDHCSLNMTDNCKIKSGRQSIYFRNYSRNEESGICLKNKWMYFYDRPGYLNENENLMKEIIC